MASVKPTVILRKCPEYKLGEISGIIDESVKDLGVKLAGRVFVKPNVVTANQGYIHHSFTHPCVTAAMVKVLEKHGAQKITVGESGGFGIPTRLFLKESGYAELGELLGVDVVDLNEHPLVKIPLEKGKHHQDMLLSKFIAEADTKVWLPKLKFHIFCSITNALKLNVGILAHKERMMFHDWRIHEKIVDLLEAGYPDLVVSDAVDITYGFESAPYPVRLGAMIIADHPLAADAVAAHIMGYAPHDVKHLEIASQRGYGSLDLEDIHVSGDITLEELAAKPKGQPRLFQVLSELDTPIRFFAGRAPDSEEICDGGCEGALKGALGTIEKRRPGSLKKARKGVIVTGIYEGDVIAPDEPVLLVGECTRVEGRLEAKKVHQIRKCPIGARDLFIKVPLIFGLPSPMLDSRDAALFVKNSVEKGFHVVKNRLLGLG